MRSSPHRRALEGDLLVGDYLCFLLENSRSPNVSNEEYGGHAN